MEIDSEDKNWGYIYIMRPKDDSRKFKLGFSGNPFRRVEDLFKTANAARLTVYYAWLTSDMIKAEKAIHGFLDYQQRRCEFEPESREFFWIAPPIFYPNSEWYTTEENDSMLDAIIEEIEDAVYTIGSKTYFKSCSIEDLWQAEVHRHFLEPKWW